MSIMTHAPNKSPLAIVIYALIAIALPMSALATPVTYEFSSGSAVVRASLEGDSQTLFESGSSLNVNLTGLSATVDMDQGPYGRLEDLVLIGEDFSIDLDESLVALDTVNVFSPTITALSGADLNSFGQFALETQADATITGALPGGFPFGPVGITSLDNTGSATGLLFVSGDEITIQILGVTVASFDQAANPDPNAPAVEVKADFTFVGTRVTTPIPEPSAALVFGVGLLVAGSRLARRER